MEHFMPITHCWNIQTSHHMISYGSLNHLAWNRAVEPFTVMAGLVISLWYHQIHCLTLNCVLCTLYNE